MGLHGKISLKWLVVLILSVAVVAPAQNIDKLKEQAVSGDAKAQAALGAMYASGNGVPLDNTQAAIWWHKASDQGDGDSQFALGVLYGHGSGVPQDYAEAYFWFDLAAAGNVTGLNSDDTAKTRDEAASHLSSAVLLRTQERARKWFEDHLADRQKTPASAASISAPVTPSALSSPAQTSDDAESGPPVQSNATLKEQAAERGDAKAQFDFGVAYHTGHGVAQNDAQAAVWYRKAAEQGLAVAQYNLAVLYANGAGVPLDKVQAGAWFRKSAEQGNVYAQEMLGSDYLTGEGVERDYAEAYFWLYIASARNAPEMVAGQRATARDAAAAYLTRTDLSGIRERARKWLEDHPAKP